MTITKIAHFVAITVLSGVVIPVSAYQMPVVGPESNQHIIPSAPLQLTQPAPIPRVTRARSSATTPTTYGPTHSNETLWSIASRLRPSTQVTIQQTIGALYRLNPSAFENNNLHGLRVGSRLRVPTLAQVRAERTAVIASRLEREKPLWETYARHLERAQSTVKAAPTATESRTTATSSIPQHASSSLVDTQPSSELVTKKAEPVSTDKMASLTATETTAGSKAVVTADKPIGHLAERYQQTNTLPLPATTDPLAVPATSGSTPSTPIAPIITTESTTAVSTTSAPTTEQVPSIADNKIVAPNHASAMIPLAVAASMATQAHIEPSDSGSHLEEQLRPLRQQLVEANAEITLQAEKNLQLNNQVNALSIEMKSLQAQLTETQNFRQETTTRLTQADLQAKELAALKIKHEALEKSSESLTHQMAKSWPVAIAVGVIPPTIIGFLLWVLYRVRQRKQQNMLSQAFEEHQSKNALNPNNVNVLAEETPDLNRSDDLLTDPDWQAITTPTDALTKLPMPNNGVEAEGALSAVESATESVLQSETPVVSQPHRDLSAMQTLAEPPSLFAGLDEAIYSPPVSDKPDVSLSSVTSALSSNAEIRDKIDERIATGVNSAALTPELRANTASHLVPESQELASLVDKDLTHSDLLGGEQNLDLGDDIVNAMLLSPNQQHSALDLDDDVHLLADSDDNTDSLLLLSDEELFTSTPVHNETNGAITASILPAERVKVQTPITMPARDDTVNTREVIDDHTALSSLGLPKEERAATLNHQTAQHTDITQHSVYTQPTAVEPVQDILPITEQFESETAYNRADIAEPSATIEDKTSDIEQVTAPTISPDIHDLTEKANLTLTQALNEPATATLATTPLFSLPEMTAEDFDLSTPLHAQAEHWSIPLPPEPQSEHEDWSAQPHLIANQLSPEERDKVTEPFVRALHPRQSIAEEKSHDDENADDWVGKLILARAYLDIDDPEGAISLLNEVITQGNESEQQQARKMLQEITPR
ncbi:MAG: FimV/HubP family polar landmark protein [Plesiomonas sp.]|uniref:FimV/HubP family polar landmark protein n=1 Tax=Plesiomonas sp. TaxID=2486279 RepID=UPI003F3248C0